jgi:hypothetical protein
VENADFLTVVSVHEDETSNTLGRAAGTIFDIAAATSDALVDTDISQTANEGIGRNLEGEADERGLSSVASQT